MDATPVLNPAGRTGVGVLTAELLERMAVEVDVVAYATTGRHPRALESAALPPSVDRTRWWRWVPAKPLRFGWRHLSWPRAESFTGPVDVVHGTNFVVPPTRRAARIVTVHDLALVHAPEACAQDNRKDPVLLRQAIDSGALVHTFSEFVRSEVLDHLGARPDQVFAIPPGPPALLPATQGDNGRAGPDRYVLALGTLQKRKNLLMLVQAFELLSASHPNLHLILAGGLDHSSSELLTAIAACPTPLRQRIHCSGEWVTESRKATLLRGASLLVYPSTYEGFGLPVLEAMVAEVPVVTTTAGALPEVSGNAALLVPPDGSDRLAEAMQSVLHDDSLRRSLVTAGRENLKRYSWDRFTIGMTELYQRAAAAP